MRGGRGDERGIEKDPINEKRGNEEWTAASSPCMCDTPGCICHLSSRSHDEVSPPITANDVRTQAFLCTSKEKRFLML